MNLSISVHKNTDKKLFGLSISSQSMTTNSGGNGIALSHESLFTVPFPSDVMSMTGPRIRAEILNRIDLLAIDFSKCRNILSVVDFAYIERWPVIERDEMFIKFGVLSGECVSEQVPPLRLYF